MLKDEEMLQLIRVKLELEMMRQHFQEKTKELDAEIGRLKAILRDQFPGLRR